MFRHGKTGICGQVYGWALGRRNSCNHVVPWIEDGIAQQTASLAHSTPKPARTRRRLDENLVPDSPLLSQLKQISKMTTAEQMSAVNNSIQQLIRGMPTKQDLQVPAPLDDEQLTRVLQAYEGRVGAGSK